jgi:hypothetical protein
MSGLIQKPRRKRRAQQARKYAARQRTKGEYARYNHAMGISRCRVSYLDQEGLDHSVEVEAESLYEAVAIVVAEFRQGEIITDTPGR